jgi:O-antigen/teichoic acid export membrane protein
MPQLKSRLVHILRWSEAYTKTDMVYLARGGWWTSLGTFIGSLLALATAVAFANLLPKEVYGAYQYILSATALIGIIAVPGMKTAVSYATARGADKTIFSIIRLKIRWGLVAGGVAGACSLYYFWNDNTVLGSGFLIAALFIPFWEVPALYVPYLQGKKRFDLINIYESIIQGLLTVVLVLALFITDKLSVILLAYFATLLATRLFFYWLTMKKAPPNDRVDESVISYGSHLSVMNAAGAISSNIDKLLLASYSFALAMPQRGLRVVRMVESLAFPKMAGQDFESIKKTLLPKVMLCLIASGATAAVYIIAAPYLFELLFPLYTDAVIYSQIAAALMALEPFSLLATALTAHARTKSLYIYNLSTPIIRAGLFIIGIPLFGLMGAAVALVLAQVFAYSLLLVLFLTDKDPRKPNF